MLEIPRHDQRMKNLSAHAPPALLFLSLTAAAIVASPELGFSRSVTPGLIVHYAGLFGPGARARLEGWKDFVRGTADRIRPVQRSAGDVQFLAPVNSFFNRVPAAVDMDRWGVEDYWATPAETLSVNGADCEDYAIAKYFMLKELGIPIAKLRLVYAKTWWSSQNAHLVLAYYSDPRADPLLLENLQGSIERAAERPDLIPVFTFNEEDLLFPQNQNDGSVPRVNPSSNRKWREVVEKLQRELTY